MIGKLSYDANLYYNIHIRSIVQNSTCLRNCIQRVGVARQLGTHMIILVTVSKHGDFHPAPTIVGGFDLSLRKSAKPLGCNPFFPQWSQGPGGGGEGTLPGGGGGA
jgi:hypothetical protein